MGSAVVGIGGSVTPKAPCGAFLDVEREKGIEPSLFAWEAKVLPLNDSRVALIVLSDFTSQSGVLWWWIFLCVCHGCDLIGAL